MSGPRDEAGGLGRKLAKKWPWLAAASANVFRNPYADIGLNYFSLMCREQAVEDAFALHLSKRLGRVCIVFGGVLLAMEILWLGVADYNRDNFADDGWYRVRMFSIAADASMGFCGLVLLISGCWTKQLAARCGPRFVEIVVLVCASMAALLSPFTETAYMADLAGRTDISDQFCQCDVWFALCLDCAVTIVSMMPVRWSSTWPLYLLVVLWYPTAHLINPRENPWTLEPIALTLTALSLVSAHGKRNAETQERQLLRAFVYERSMRAESDFKLSAQNATASGCASSSRAPPSVTSSLETAEVFEVGGAASRSIEFCLQHIKDKATEEQWAIAPDELLIFTSKRLGEGNFGSVMAGSLSGLPVAVKIPRDPFTSEQVQPLIAMATELRTLRKIRHPNIVMFYGALVDAPNRDVALVLEDIQGKDLGAFVEGWTSVGQMLPEKDLYRLACGMTLALRYLHGHSPAIVHADLKPGNVLVEIFEGKRPCPKLVDFGLSRILSGKVKEFGGTIAWMAPELVQSSRAPDTMVDVFGYGRLSLFIVTGARPFKAWPRKQVFQALESGDIQVPDLDDDADTVATAIWQIGNLCVAADPAERPRMRDVADTLQNLALNQYVESGLCLVASEIWGRGLFEQPKSKEPTLRQESPVPWEVAIRQLRQPTAAQSEGSGDAGPPGGSSLSPLHRAADPLFDSGSNASSRRRRRRASSLPDIVESNDEADHFADEYASASESSEAVTDRDTSLEWVIGAQSLGAEVSETKPAGVGGGPSPAPDVLLAL